MKIYDKAILPQGFKACGLKSGIKKSGKLDLALFYTETPAIVSCKATSNQIKAAPIVVNEGYLKVNKKFHGIIANSGNANAFCGRKGLQIASEMSVLAAEQLSVSKESILVASTGIIGKELPIDNVRKAIPQLAAGLSSAGIDKAKRAIMTTDKFCKEITVRFKSGPSSITVCGIAKGAGMISPKLATMLVFIFTDASITQKALNDALNGAANNSFNRITVDGCMSTNDTVILLANQTAGNNIIDKANSVNANKSFLDFQKALNIVCLKLAKMIVSDGEGATKTITVKVDGARSQSDARIIALAIANSNLFKTAMFASSPNIVGRIVAAAGASGIAVKEEDLRISYSPLQKKEVAVNVSVGKGNASFIIYTSDLTHAYVKINAEYN